MVKFQKNNKESRPNKKTVFKPKFVKINVSIADSDFYKTNIDSLYNLLDGISFDKVAIPVHISKAELFDNPQAKGLAVFGTIEKFNNDNTFTVSISENNASKFNSSEHVMSIRCKKNYENGEITYVSSFCIVKGTSIQSIYDDVEQAMLNNNEDETTEEKESE